MKNYDDIEMAVINGNLEFVKSFPNPEKYCGNMLINLAAHRGQYKIFKYFHSVGCSIFDWEPYGCLKLAEEGNHKNIIKYICSIVLNKNEIDISDKDICFVGILRRNGNVIKKYWKEKYKKEFLPFLLINNYEFILD